MKKNITKFILFYFFFLLIFVSCSTTSHLSNNEESFLSPKDELILEKDFSEVLNQNIQLESSFKPSKNTFYMKFSGKRLIFHLVAINLTQTQVFSVFPEDSFLSDFAKINNSTIAINACPFTKDLEPVGIVIENENLISPPVTKYSAFVLDNQNIPKIVQNQFEINPEDTKIAIGGFFTIIKDGKPFGSYADIQDSRTVIGISEDNKQLFLLVVEGEFFSNSQGLSYKNCTDLLLKIGVKNAIQMDGGGSTSLYITNKNMLSYKSLRKTAINLSIIDEQ